MKKKKIVQNTTDFRSLFYSFLIIGIFCMFVAGVLGFQLAHRIEHRPFPVPRETNINLIQSWMTIRYISHTYKIPEEELIQKLSLSQIDTTRTSLEKIAKKTNQSTEELTAKIKIIITEFQSTHSRPEVRTFE